MTKTNTKTAKKISKRLPREPYFFTSLVVQVINFQSLVFVLSLQNIKKITTLPTNLITKNNRKEAKNSSVYCTVYIYPKE